MMYLIIIIAFIFGLIFGSFINVCIYRIPNDISIIKPASFCPNCFKSVKWYNNLPVLSYLLLRGKCADCGAKINVTYPLVEILTAVITCLWFLRFPFTATPFIFSVFGMVLIVISGIDIKERIIIPHLSYPLIFIGIIAAHFNEFLFEPKILHSLGGVILGGGLILLVRFLGTIIFKKEAMGLGDVKLMMGIGAFIGVGGIFYVLFIASFIGSIIGVAMRIIQKEKIDYMPFGPYLSAAAVLYIHFREFLTDFLLF